MVWIKLYPQTNRENFSVSFRKGITFDPENLSML
jgi:hypothetical protein